MDQKEDEVILHLKESLSHLEHALRKTVQTLKETPNSKSQYGYIWEEFLGTFFGKVISIGKESKLNLLTLISFDRLKKLARMQ